MSSSFGLHHRVPPTFFMTKPETPSCEAAYTKMIQLPEQWPSYC